MQRNCILEAPFGRRAVRSAKIPLGIRTGHSHWAFALGIFYGHSHWAFSVRIRTGQFLARCASSESCPLLIVECERARKCPLRVSNFGAPGPNGAPLSGHPISHRFLMSPPRMTVLYIVGREGSSTVVWRNSVVRCTGRNTALWLVRGLAFCMCQVWISKLWDFQANHNAVFLRVLVHQTMEFRQTIVWVIVVDPTHVLKRNQFVIDRLLVLVVRQHTFCPGTSPEPYTLSFTLKPSTRTSNPKP
jgi:hypothetical protein